MTQFLDSKIDEKLNEAEKALENGLYEDGLSYLDLAKVEIASKKSELKEKIQVLSTQISGLETSSGAKIAKLAKNLEIIKFKEKRINSLHSTIEKEKERAQSYRTLVKSIADKGISDKIIKEKEKIDEFLKKPRSLKPKGKYFVSLRKWNSFTPLINTPTHSTQGGGYFLVWEDKGIVIDPGISFIENFFSNGFSILDIDLIILTHSHVDHTADLEGILTLMFEANKHLTNPHKISIYANIGAANKFMEFFTTQFKYIDNIFILKPFSEYNISDTIRMKTIESKHLDLYAPTENCVGLTFVCKGNDDQTVKLGITSDTGYYEELSTYYGDLKNNLMIFHIGSILEEELQPGFPKKANYKSHLGLKGIFNLIYDIKPRLALISELGEEMSGSIHQLPECLKDVSKETIILPTDSGIKIDLIDFGNPFKLNCQKCDNPTEIAKIKVRPTDSCGNLEYICQTCVELKTD